jgi:hypothetical protein
MKWQPTVENLYRPSTVRRLRKLRLAERKELERHHRLFKAVMRAPLQQAKQELWEKEQKLRSLKRVPKKDRPRCGARCRDGHPCQARAFGRTGRCRMHGGGRARREYGRKRAVIAFVFGSRPKLVARVRAEKQERSARKARMAVWCRASGERQTLPQG